MSIVNKPQLKKITAFDAGTSCTINYTWNSAFMIRGCTIYFYSHNNTNTPLGSISLNNVGLKIQLTPEQLINAGVTLSNGNKYYASISVSYTENNTVKSTDESNKVIFRCEEKPTFIIQSPTDDLTVENTNFPIRILYAQSNGVMLDQYVVRIYQNGHEVYNSGVIYGQGLTFSSSSSYSHYVIMEHNITSLLDMSSYYVEVEGYLASDSIIDNGMTVYATNEGGTLTKVPFSINVPKSYYEYSNLSLENDFHHGCINISSDVAVVNGVGYKYKNIDDDVTYIDGSMVDLLEHGKYVKYASGFGFDGDFVLFFNGCKFQPSEKIMEIKSSKETISVYFHCDMKCTLDWRGEFFNFIETQPLRYYFRMVITGESQNTTCCSKYISPTSSSDMINVTIEKTGNLFSIQALLGGETP